MTVQIVLVLLILGVAIVLFATERIRVDVVSLMVLLSLFLTGIISVEDAFGGFANPAVITVWAIYMMSDGMARVGVADMLGARILRLAGNDQARLVFYIMLMVGIMSAFTNNIGATAVLLPAVISIGTQTNVPASKLLIPLAFGSLLGGVTTLIGTPPNLLVSAALVEAGLAPFNLLDFTPLGVIILASSILYMVFIGRHLLPERREVSHSADLARDYHLRDYLCELTVLPNSPLVDKTLEQARLGEIYDLTVIALVRNGETHLDLVATSVLHAGDRLLCKGSVQDMLSLQEQLGISFDANTHVRVRDLISADTILAELVVSQRADFIGQTLQEADFRNRYDLTVLAIWHDTAHITASLEDIPLRLGDVLLVHGRRERIESLRGHNGFLVLGPLEIETPRHHKAPLAVAIFASMIGLVLVGVLHISAAAVMGTVLFVLTGVMTMDEAYRAVEWKSVFLIAGMLPMSIAMQQTGAAQLAADSILGLVGSFGARGLLLGLFILTTILTGFMSNAAAAVLVAPIAISAAQGLGLEPHGFVMGVGIAASSAFFTPVGHQANVLVYGPGGYRFFDYTKVGVPLTILIWILMLIFLPVFFPL
ncbi:MAG: SLC13 family permease [Anaerolineales bacterium]|nr:SLC13 family permease [Anaerolineales bacterium]MCB8954260.1 SLC13 family permease [Ardenticatenales bacterium]